MTVAQAVAFVERIRERTGKYPGLYCSEYRLRQMLYGPGVTAPQRQTLGNSWLLTNQTFGARASFQLPAAPMVADIRMFKQMR
jgi:hypothetical protein